MGPLLAPQKIIFTKYHLPGTKPRNYVIMVPREVLKLYNLPYDRYNEYDQNMPQYGRHHPPTGSP